VAQAATAIQDHEDQKQRAPSEPKEGVKWGALVGAGDAMEILEIRLSNFEHRARRPDFPPPAATISRRRLWRRTDIKRYASGVRKGWITKTRNELQGHILDVVQICQRLGLTIGQFDRRWEAQDWSTIPPPDGRASNSLWWRRDRVEKWEQKRRE
jgi:hypothetical protein